VNTRAQAFAQSPIVLLMLVSLVWSAQAGDAGAPAQSLLVTRATLWTDRGQLSQHEVLITDGRVAAVGRSGSLPRTAGTRVIDAAGDTLLPGLIDAHVHLVFGARVPPEFTGPAMYAVTGRQLLRSGVTSGRIHLMSLADGPEVKRTASADGAPMPRLRLGGPGLFGGRPDWESPSGNAWGVKSVADAMEKVRRFKQAGVDWIALHEVRRFEPGEAEAIVAEAKRLDLGLMVGGDHVGEVERGLELGVDSVEYLDTTATERYPDELLARMKARGTTLFCVPAVGYPHRSIEYWRGTMSLDEPLLTELMPPDIARFSLEALREDRAKPGPALKRLKSMLTTLPQKFRQLRGAGLQMVVGTDCGSVAHLHVDAIWWEMETWRKLGVDPHDVIRAATTRAAKLLRQPDVGHLDVGARGDFVLYRGAIDGGPLTVQRVRTVAKGGLVFVDEGKWSQ
jgi:tryptophan 2-monooxygenase